MNLKLKISFNKEISEKFQNIPFGTLHLIGFAEVPWMKFDAGSKYLTRRAACTLFVGGHWFTARIIIFSYERRM